VKSSVEGHSEKRVEDLLKKRSWQLDKVDKLKVLLAAASIVEPEVYLLYDLSRQMVGSGRRNQATDRIRKNPKGKRRSERVR